MRFNPFYNTLKSFLLIIGTTLSLVGYSYGAGVVAETNGGKVIKFEWDTHGTGNPPAFVQAELKILAPDGKLLFEDRFLKKSVIEYDEVDHKGEKYEVKLYLKSERATFNLHFVGTNRELDLDGEESEIDVLVRLLKDSDRKFEKGSSLSIVTPIGKFSFRDVLCSIYGDV